MTKEVEERAVQALTFLCSCHDNQEWRDCFLVLALGLWLCKVAWVLCTPVLGVPV